VTYVYDWQTKHSTRFTAVSSKPIKEGEERYPEAHVDLHHEVERPNFATVRRVGMPSQYEVVRGDDPEAGHPTQLFSNEPGTITGAFSHPDMRAHLPTLLGMAAERNMRHTGGRMPVPSDSLSAQSSPMVQKLRAKGAQFPANPHNPTDKVTNKITNNDRHMNFATPYDPGVDLSNDDVTIAPHEQVQSGRQLMRNMLRSSKVNPNEFGSTPAASAPSDGFKSSWQDDPAKPRQMALFSGRDLMQAQQGMGPIANGRK